jgi:hypothetical protein
VPMTKVSMRSDAQETTGPAGTGRDGAAVSSEDRTLSRQASIRAAWPWVNITITGSST